MRFLQRIIDLIRGKRPRLHPTMFAPHVRFARDGIRRLGHAAEDERRTVWELVHGRSMRIDGQTEWAFEHPAFPRGPALGLCFWGNPITVLLGSDGRGAYSRRVADHEAAHVVRMQVGDFCHHPAFDGLFWGWREMRPSISPLTPDCVMVADYADGTSEVRRMTEEQFAAIRYGARALEATV